MQLIGRLRETALFKTPCFTGYFKRPIKFPKITIDSAGTGFLAKISRRRRDQASSNSNVTRSRTFRTQMVAVLQLQLRVSTADRRPHSRLRIYDRDERDDHSWTNLVVSLGYPCSLSTMLWFVSVLDAPHRFCGESLTDLLWAKKISRVR